MELGTKSISVTDASESQLIARAKEYDPDALSELYGRFADLIFRYVYYRVGDRATAEDLVGDVFVKAIEHLPEYQQQGRPFEAWLYRIASARVIDYYRRQRFRRTAPLNERIAAARESDPDHTAAERDDARRTWAAVERLPDEQQHVITLRFGGGYSIAEVARLIDKSEGAVKAIQHRALASLRRVLGNEP